MKRPCLISLTILVMLAAQLFSMSKTDSHLSAIQAELKLLETWVEAQQLYREIPGIAIGLVYDQELIYAKGFGFADLEHKSPVSPATPFRMASITKTFTATAILQLRDAGKLRLDDPVVNYLPWFNIKQSYTDQPPITIRQLLTHTSGLPREAAFPYWTDHNFPTMEQIKATLATQETIYPPATRIKYSNLGLSLAGEIVAAVSGESYENYIRSHILEPLGMTGSAVIPDESYKRSLVTPYGHRLEGSSHEVEEYTETKGIAAAASLASTVTDLANYVSLQFRENDNAETAVVKGSTLKEMHRVQFLEPSWSSGWGLGWSVWQRNGKTINGHAGWVGGNRTQIMFIPEDKIGVIILTNSDDGEPSYFARHVLDYMGPVILAEYAPAQTAPTFDPSWRKYAGTYVEPGPYYTVVLIKGESLVMSTLSYPPEDNPGSEVVELTPVGRDTFRMTGDNGNGELLIFEYDKTGEIYQVKVGSNYIYPEALYKGR